MKWNNTALNEIQEIYKDKFSCFKCKKELKTALHWYIGQKNLYFFCIPCFKKNKSELNELG